ncbi:MAG: hypothetical protein R3A48_13280 [Polyangiales bacterium]
MDALLTDRNELATLGAYLREGLAGRRAVFELSLRGHPSPGQFLLISGIYDSLRAIRALRFGDVALTRLRAAPELADVRSDALLSWLEAFRFCGDLDAVSDGEAVFAGEPVLRVEGTLAEVRALRTLLLGVIRASRGATQAASGAPEAPLLDGAYELVALEDARVGPEGDALRGRTQVWRRLAPDGAMLGDTVDLADAPLGPGDAGVPLLAPKMRKGKLLRALPPAAEAAAEASRRALRSLRALPAGRYPVSFSAALGAPRR